MDNKNEFDLHYIEILLHKLKILDFQNKENIKTEKLKLIYKMHNYINSFLYNYNNN